MLDKLVPGYYHRRHENGDMCTSTCCNNTASEHALFERLMVDDAAHWARAYRVDGLRFDVMGHHLVSNMRAVRAALDALTLCVFFCFLFVCVLGGLAAGGGSRNPYN